jgi:hypothetical protein
VIESEIEQLEKEQENATSDTVGDESGSDGRSGIGGLDGRSLDESTDAFGGDHNID